jgi:hypothetical protein
MIVKVKIENNTRRPDIDESIYSGWSVIKDFGDTMEVEVTKRPEVISKENEAMKEIAELYLRENMSRMPEQQLERLSVILDRFDESQSYSEERLVLKDNKPHIIKGGKPTPVINNPKVTRITRLQGMLMLQNIGKYDEVDAIMQQAPRPTQIAFYNANFWERDSQMINEAGHIIGMSETELDQFFIAASQIVLP